MNDYDISKGTIRTKAIDPITGKAGHIAISTPLLAIRDGARIEASTEGSGRAGDITLDVGQLTLTGGAQVSTSTAGSAGAGAVRMVVTDSVTLLGPQSGLFSQATGGGSETIGGNITLEPELTILDHSHIMANAFQGKGGNVSIVAEGFLAEPTSLVSASSVLGISGTVDIRAPLVDLRGSLAPLPQTFLQAVLSARCAERRQGGPASSLVQRGRHRVPTEPSGASPSPLYPANQGSASQADGLRLDGNGPSQVGASSAQKPSQAGFDSNCSPWQGRKR